MSTPSIIIKNLQPLHIVTKRWGWRFLIMIEGVDKSLYVFFYWVCDLGQFNRPWLIKNDILMQILILWDFVLKNWNCEVVFLEYLIYFSELIFSNQPLLLRGIHIGSLKISNLFLRYKDGKWIFWKNTKTLDTKRAHSLKLNCEYIWYKK